MTPYAIAHTKLCRVLTAIQYDTLGTAVGVGLPQIGKYNGLVYSGWAIDTAGVLTGTNGGLVAHSPNNTAIAVTTETIATGNPGTITAGSDMRCFTLQSLYYGCSLNSQQGQVGLATGCTIQLDGYTNGKERLLRTLTFTYPQPVCHSSLF